MYVARLATHRNRVRLKVPRSARNPEPNARVFGRTVGATQSEQSFREIKSRSHPAQMFKF